MIHPNSIEVPGSCITRCHASLAKFYTSNIESSDDRGLILQVHRIPVVDGQAKCIGIVTRTDIFTALALDSGNTKTLA